MIENHTVHNERHFVYSRESLEGYSIIGVFHE